MQRNALGLQCRLQLAQGQFDGARRLERVGAELAGQREQHAGLAHDQRVAKLERGGFPDCGDVANAHRRCPARDQHRVGERANIGRGRGSLDQHALAGEIHEARAAQRQRAARGVGDVGERQSEVRQPGRVGQDLQLPHVATKDDDMGDSRHGQQPRLDDPVGRISEGKCIHLVRGEADLEQVHGARDERRELGNANAARQAAAELRKALGNALPRDVQVDAILERYGHDRQARDRFRAHGRDSRGAIDGVLDLLGHQFLNLLRGEARRLGLDGDLRRHELREHVERCAQCAPCAQHQRYQGQGSHDAAASYAELDQPMHHS